jgi:hypothetical protein
MEQLEYPSVTLENLKEPGWSMQKPLPAFHALAVPMRLDGSPGRLHRRSVVP